MSWPPIEATAILFHRAGIPAGLTAQIATVVRTAGLNPVAKLGAKAISTPEAGEQLARFLGAAKARGIPDADAAAALRRIARVQTALFDGIQSVEGGAVA